MIFCPNNSILWKISNSTPPEISKSKIVISDQTLTTYYSILGKLSLENNMTLIDTLKNCINRGTSNWDTHR